MADAFRFTDEFGPSKIVHINESSSGLKAIVVVDNIAAGPSIGGVRMAPDVSLEECFRLARTMTMKNAAAALPHGGGKAVIFADPHMDAAEKEVLIRAFANAIRDLVDYIPGPDMGNDEQSMGWVYDEIGRAVGLPPEIGGIPLDAIGATGFGLTAAIEEAQAYCDVKIDGARVAIQGFGSVGKHAARFLCERGAVLVAAADSGGTISDPGGIDVGVLAKIKAAGQSVTEYSGGTAGQPDDIIDADCDIWIPAARPDVIRGDNVTRLKARLVAQGANIPITEEAEGILHERGILSLPDFIANAGGVICAAVEYHGGTQISALQVIDQKIKDNTREVLQAAKTTNILPRQAALAFAERRVRTAMSLRRWN